MDWLTTKKERERGPGAEPRNGTCMYQGGLCYVMKTEKNFLLADDILVFVGDQADLKEPVEPVQRVWVLPKDE